MLFGISEDHLVSALSLDKKYLTPSSFYFTYSGTSMQGILTEGDILLVDRALTPKDGDLVVGATQGEEYICRRYAKKSAPPNQDLSWQLFGVVKMFIRERGSF